VVKPLSTGDKGETPESLSAQEVTLSAPLSIAECRIMVGLTKVPLRGIRGRS